jgi:SAM-dependent methyltransferase
MSDAPDSQRIRRYWERDGLGERILNVLRDSGRDLDALTIDILAPLDQFHGGGKPATERLARLANLTPGTRVLDVGGGLGGPARTLAVLFDCQVEVLDLTESYVHAGELLTNRLRLSDRVRFHVGNALELPFDDGSFDVVWTQNSGMNIADKDRLYSGFHRVIRPGGRLALQEPLLGTVQPVIYPQMWARDESSSILLTPVDMQAVIERAGFRLVAWEDVTAVTSLAPLPAPGAPPTLQSLVLGDELPLVRANGTRNFDEGRLVNVHAVFDRP